VNEWILLLALNLSGPLGDIRDVSLSTVPGFTSQAACETAARQIAERTLALVGKARGQQGVQSQSTKSVPALNTECVQVKK
jgi:hypothetical protein